MAILNHAHPPRRPPLVRPAHPLNRARDGTDLDTLADAANFILALPEHYQDRNSWKRATELLMQAAEQDGDIEAATEQFERALFLEARYVRR